MIKQLTDYIKQEGREFFVMVGVTLLACVICFAYIYLLGTHLTEARNNYNHAQFAYDLGNYPAAKTYLEKSLAEWKTTDAQQLLDKVNDKSRDL